MTSYTFADCECEHCRCSNLRKATGGLPPELVAYARWPDTEAHRSALLAHGWSVDDVVALCTTTFEVRV